MKKMLSVIAILVVGCASGNCRYQADQKAAQNANNSAATSPETKPDVSLPPGAQMKSDRVKVFKYDGSLQCGMGKAIALDAMKKDLKGISVYSSANLQDGLMHVSACGTPTGKANVYEIDRSNLEKAIKAGFREWTFD